MDHNEMKTAITIISEGLKLLTILAALLTISGTVALLLGV